jgi:hypothetical protein
MVKFFSWTYEHLFYYPILGRLNKNIINVLNFNYDKLFIKTYYGRERKYVIENEPVINILELDYYNEYEVLFDGKSGDKFFEHIKIVNENKETNVLNDMIGFDSLTTTINNILNLNGYESMDTVVLNIKYSNLESGDDVTVCRTIDGNTFLKYI